ncbi:MAG: hypothetical protein NVS4B2_01630 [Chloroflexota bacterium]
MRIAFMLAVGVFLLLPGGAVGASPRESIARVTHPVLAGNQQQTLSVLARDLSGSPMSGAAITATIHYGTTAVTYHLPRTNASGESNITFRPPAGAQWRSATVDIHISNGFLQVALSTAFRRGSAPVVAAGPSLKLIARVLPAEVVAPAPAYIVVATHTARGIITPRVHVWVAARFKEGVVHLVGIADTAGVATVRLSTGTALSTQTVHIVAGAQWAGARGTSESTILVRASARSSAPVETPTLEPPTVAPTPTATPTLPPPTVAPVATPTATSVPQQEPAPLPSATPTPTLTPTPTAVPTWTPMPTWTPTPTPTATLIPTPNSTPVPASTPTPSPVAQVIVPTSTPVPSLQCPGSQDGCIQAMLSIINKTRAQHNLQAYSLDTTLSNCAYAHSVHMQQAGVISHDQFPQPDLCIGYSAGGENVGTFNSGNELQDLQSMHSQMMSEGYAPGCSGSHACNILSDIYTVVGIGIYHAPNGSTWLTEDFIKP